MEENAPGKAKSTAALLEKPKTFVTIA